MNTPALPDALLPWRVWLNWFSADLAPEVGNMLRCLSPLLGRFHGQQLGGEPEPDGLGDLMRRGSYERLLSSEWLLADDMPEEFLRRAAEGEHVFLAPRSRAKQAEKRIVALFDAGPMQLGAPRLAHIAFWILLARRAQQVGGEFYWGILQESKLQNSQDEHALKALLKGRCYHMPQAGHWRTWQETIQGLAEQAGECWLIGATAPTSINCFSHQVQIEPDLTSTSLQVSIAQGSTKRSMTLPLPAQSLAVELLQAKFLTREPKAAKQTPSYALSILRPPIISGNRVAVSLSGEAGVLVYQLQTQKTRFQHWKQYTLLALAFHDKQLGGLLVQEDKLRFWQIHGLEYGEMPEDEQFALPIQKTSLLSMVWVKERKKSLVYVLDTVGHIWRWQQSGSTSKHVLVESNVLAFSSLGNTRLLYIHEKKRSIQVVCIEYDRILTYQCAYLNLSTQPKSALIGCGLSLHPDGTFGVAICLHTEPVEIWRVFIIFYKEVSQQQEVTLPSGTQVLALIPDNGYAKGFSLVLLNAHQHKLLLFNGKQTEELYTCNHRVAQHAVCPSTGNIALLTVAHELIVYSPKEREVKLFVQGNKEAT